MLAQLQERQQHLLERFGEMKVVQESHGVRITKIESSQPGLLEFRRWALAVVAAVAGFVGSSYWTSQVVNQPPSAPVVSNPRESQVK
jgi:hypothetical protein